jgi:hypothetical protein
MRKQPTEDRDILVRAITAAARELGPESPWFQKAVEWFVDNVPVLVGLFGQESQMYWDIKFLRDPATSRANHIATVIRNYGYQPDDFDAVVRKYDRWHQRSQDIFSEEAELGEVLWHCVKHLYPPPRDPDGETETFYV